MYPGAIKKLVQKLREKKVQAREAKMKKYVIVQKSWAAKLKAFESKRKDEPVKPGRFIGLMQEDRKKKKVQRKKYSDIAFDFAFDSG